MSYKLLIHENPLMLLPSLAVAVGLNEALMLQQIHYWIDPRVNKHYHKEKHWVYNSYQQWLEQFPFWSERTLRRTIKSLEEKNLIISNFFNKNPFDKTKWYTINYDKLKELETLSDRIGHFGHIDKVKKDSSERSDRTLRNDKMDTSMSPTRTEEKDKKATCIYETENTTKNTHIKHQIPKEEREIILDLIEIWNKKLNQEVFPTEKRLKNLKNIFLKFFEADVEKWEKFVSKIGDSDFLSGKVTQFKATFDWSINEDNVYKILEGSYSQNTNKDETNDTQWESKTSDFIENIEDTYWKSISEFLVKRFGLGTFQAWFADAKWLGNKNGIFILQANSKFKKEWIENNFAKAILEKLREDNKEKDTLLEITIKE